MSYQRISAYLREQPVPTWVVVLLAGLVAILSARPYAGSWNDGSRLAIVECLVDYHTLTIDRSIFVQVPPAPLGLPPVYYSKDAPGILDEGTLDKLYIDGHYYSDKSPVPAVLMAVGYEALQWTTGLTARDRPDQFCYWMNLLSSGLAYVLAVGCIHQMGRRLSLVPGLGLLLTGSFALCTVAPAYSEQVNNHMLLLGVMSALMLTLAGQTQGGQLSQPVFIGMLAGLGYTIDLGVGPVLLITTFFLIAWRRRKLASLVVFALAAVPWIALHHGLNYAIGGTLAPANSVASYFQWPGCPFNEENMTGTWKHPNLGHFLIYAADLLFGKRGFVGHNLPLFLALPAVFLVLAHRVHERAEVVYVAALCGGVWLLYAATSNNLSGVCCSVRWLVPLLAPLYYVLAIALRERPDCRHDLLVLSAFGAVLSGFMWWQGPWMAHLIKAFWPIQALALLTWGWIAYRRMNTTRSSNHFATSGVKRAA
ncbi:MAG: hypothetical protein ACJ8FY_00295 [Gemmataceae bacterium]